MTVAGANLADGQLANAETDMYTVPADTRAYVKSIVCSNTGAGDNTVTLYLTPSGGTSRRIVYAILASGSTLYYDEPTTLDAADKIRGYATNAAEVDYIISGGTESTA